jgi:hypothetical protein
MKLEIDTAVSFLSRMIQSSLPASADVEQRLQSFASFLGEALVCYHSQSFFWHGFVGGVG